MFCKKNIELRLIGRHLCRNTKRELSTTDWKQLWPLTWAEMTSDARQTRGQSLGSFQKALTRNVLLYYQNLLVLKLCHLTSWEQKTNNYRFTLVNKHEGTTWHFLVTFDLNGVDGIVCCEHRKVCCNYCHKDDVRAFLTSDHSFAQFHLSNQLVNSYLDDLLCSG